MNNKKTKKAPTIINEFKAEVKRLKSQLRDSNTENDKVFEHQEELIHRLELENAKLKLEKAEMGNQIANMHLENATRLLENNREKARTFNEDLDRMHQITKGLILKNQLEKLQSTIEGINIPLNLVATWENESLKN